ncbi:hypothetical protein PSm6_47030 [Pseudomonas solani]|uniref:DUF3592 domain-containing protein n=1 Tax=Pseudomonas solani TaxID=2731552 RepID=A0ABM7LF96_9PSED|nr:MULTISPECIES: DUF3592 domain-containing protein [Pseudomonas]EQM69615.1 hypothetical protein L682_01435 [Pseudomonas alcaligenes OT 69]MBB4820902.1 hypothetical protein [Pseudomonas alcaligenes]MDN4147325.1 hypothetical protein [Pseudomonas tohonis]MDU9415975.1 hypothetical protein [Pseudomonas sp. zfem005]WCD83033.1 hypothetical protein PI990_13700 [Pseudomonas sp. TUM22785]
MISFKTSPETHRTLSKVSMILLSLAAVIGAGFLIVTAILNYFNANAILKDHSEVLAPVSLDSVTEEHHRRGRTSETYHFHYSFEVAGKPYDGTFETSASNAEPYLHEGASVKVGYANAEPSHFGRLDVLQSQADFGSSITRALTAVPLAALLAFILHLMLTRRLFVPRETSA